MAYKQSEWHESWPSYLQKHTSKVVSQVRPNQHQCGSDTESDLHLHLLETYNKYKVKTNMKKN